MKHASALACLFAFFSTNLWFFSGDSILRNPHLDHCLLHLRSFLHQPQELSWSSTKSFNFLRMPHCWINGTTSGPWWHREWLIAVLEGILSKHCVWNTGFWIETPSNYIEPSAVQVLKLLTCLLVTDYTCIYIYIAYNIYILYIYKSYLYNFQRTQSIAIFSTPKVDI